MRFSDLLPLSAALAFKDAPHFPDATVKLEDIEKSLNIYLHALMRSGEQSVVADGSKKGLRRGFSAQRHMKSLVWAESGSAHLPEVIQRFEDGFHVEDIRSPFIQELLYLFHVHH